MSVVHWGIVLDISDITSDTDAAIGLYSGVFYWVSGRPGYSGSGYSGEAPASKTWRQGIITSVNKMSPMIRMADGAEVSGGYGSLSGFNLEVDNTSLFWNTLESNAYHIINRPIDVYVFIDDVSFHVWGGLVSANPRTDMVYKFTCEDDFKVVHKPLPPDEVSDDNFPDANSKVIGDTIPICFGNVKYAKMLPVFSDMDAQNIVYVNKVFGTIAAMASYDASAKTITLYTMEVDIQADQYKGYYARAVIGGSDQSIRILSNAATVKTGGYRLYKTVFTLESWFEEAPEADNAIETHQDYVSSPDNVTAPNLTNSTPIWYFEIVKFEAIHIVSNNSIDSYIAAAGKQVQIRYFDKDEDDFVDVSEIRNEESLTGIGATSFPGIKITSKSVDLEGEIKKTFSITPDDIRFRIIAIGPTGSEQSKTFDPSGDNPNLYDQDESTSYNIVTQSTGAGGNTQNIVLEFALKIPEQIFKADYDNVYILIDFRFLSVQASTSFLFNLAFLLKDYMSRNTGGLIATASIFNWALGSGLDDNLAAGVNTDFPLIPKAYYNEPDDDAVYHSKKARVDISSIISDNKLIAAYPTFRLWVNYIVGSASSGNDVTFTAKEIAFVGEKAVNVIDDDLYTILKGERVLI